ncbi:MAG: hypothetical protein AAB561_02010 [Patescibacteria group bacterium]
MNERNRVSETSRPDKPEPEPTEIHPGEQHGGGRNPRILSPSHHFPPWRGIPAWQMME